MNGQEVLRIVDMMHRDKSIPKEFIFQGIESAVLLAARKHYDDEAEDVLVTLNRDTGILTAKKAETELAPEVLGRIAAQAAKQFMIQKIREAECDAVFNEYVDRKGE